MVWAIIASNEQYTDDSSSDSQGETFDMDCLLNQEVENEWPMEEQSAANVIISEQPPAADVPIQIQRFHTNCLINTGASVSCISYLSCHTSSYPIISIHMQVLRQLISRLMTTCIKK